MRESSEIRREKSRLPRRIRAIERIRDFQRRRAVSSGSSVACLSASLSRRSDASMLSRSKSRGRHALEILWLGFRSRNRSLTIIDGVGDLLNNDGTIIYLRWSVKGLPYSDGPGAFFGKILEPVTIYEQLKMFLRKTKSLRCTFEVDGDVTS